MIPFYLVGRADEERPGRGVDERKSPTEIMRELDASKPVIVMEHEPKFLQEVADAGVDLHLCGHTHDGQTFPASLTTDIVWGKFCRISEKGQYAQHCYLRCGPFRSQYAPWYKK